MAYKATEWERSEMTKRLHVFVKGHTEEKVSRTQEYSRLFCDINGRLLSSFEQFSGDEKRKCYAILFTTERINFKFSISLCPFWNYLNCFLIWWCTESFGTKQLRLKAQETLQPHFLLFFSSNKLSFGYTSCVHKMDLKNHQKYHQKLSNSTSTNWNKNSNFVWLAIHLLLRSGEKNVMRNKITKSQSYDMKTFDWETRKINWKAVNDDEAQKYWEY